jgi:hypothetical protein
MNDPTQILLQEFRAFRDSEFRDFRNEVAAWKQETGERVTALEVKVKDGLEDNGTPSRMTAVETRVSGLEKIRWKTTGIVSAIWAIVTLTLTVAASYMPHGGKH